MGYCCLALQVLGAVVAVYLLMKVVLFLAKHSFQSRLNLKEYCKTDWALVTGSTDGIGKAYAFALAKRGFNLITVSRNQQKLESVAAELSEKYPSSKIKVIAVDFVNDDGISYRLKIAKELEGLAVGVLVNNAGMSYEMPSKFLNAGEIVDDVHDSIIKCNICSVNNMTALILPQMVERKRGVIVNISSLSCSVPSPFVSVYGASKAYVDKLSQGLAAEYRDDGIVVQSVMPGFVATKMSKIKRTSSFVPSPSTFVESALSRIGIEDRTTGYWAHDLMLWGATLFPERLVTKIVIKEMSNMREKALRKASKKTE